MAILNGNELRAALVRLGELAVAQGFQVRLLIVGGGAMVLAYNAREATRDLDVAILEPSEAARLRAAAGIVGAERGWPEGWLNDAAKSFLICTIEGPLVHRSPGIDAFIPVPEQLLAMKLTAWRDDLDVADATRLLQEVPGQREAVWDKVKPFLYPGSELKAHYAFLDLWDATRGDA